jgi:hypothetical protein
MNQNGTKIKNRTRTQTLKDKNGIKYGTRLLRLSNPKTRT